MDIFKCRNCQNTFRLIDKHPNTLCSTCYSQTPNADKPMTDRELAKAWWFKNSNDETFINRLDN